MEYVLPLPVAPYANTVPLRPRAAPTASSRMVPSYTSLRMHVPPQVSLPIEGS